MNQWMLKKGEDRRIRSGHPWVFSNELSSSPKGIVPGDSIELLDNKGNFLARGYGNPHSLIAFRALTWRLEEKDSDQLSFVRKRLLDAWKFRFYSGLQNSFRLCFAEGDELPGLIIDRYVLITGQQVFCVQLLSAGMQKLVRKDLVAMLTLLADEAMQAQISYISGKYSFVVLRNDVNIRKLEGLNVENPTLLNDAGEPIAPNIAEYGINLQSCQILVDSPFKGKTLEFFVNLIEGQKTGFFLDQRRNIFELLATIERGQFFTEHFTQNRPIRVLDLCCYAGHWSAQIGHFLKAYNVESTLVDISKDALSISQKNVQKYVNKVECLNLDVAKDLEQLPDNYFDIVVADPPAFIKAKKDIPQGSHAYLKINSHAFRVAAFKGLVVSCSCSGLLTELDFFEVLRKSQQRASRTSYRVLTTGGHSPDHPVRLSFSEGKYLKMITHLKF